MTDDNIIVIENPHRNPLSDPFLFIPLFEGDNGDPRRRENMPGIANRDPFGVRCHEGQITLTVGNSGLVASDLIRIDYEIRLCSNRDHGRADGFLVDHAEDLRGTTVSDIGRIDFVPAGASRTLTIVIPDLASGEGWPDWLVNVYFRARVSCLFSSTLPVNQWNFVMDPAVTEAAFPILETSWQSTP